MKVMEERKRLREKQQPRAREQLVYKGRARALMWRQGSVDSGASEWRDRRVKKGRRGRFCR